MSSIGWRGPVLLSINYRLPGEITAAEENGGLTQGSGTGPATDRKGPERTCLGCRAKKQQEELRRLALDPDFPRPKVVWDPAHRLGGRGAWLCRDRTECLNLALKRRVWLRAFRLAMEPDLAQIRSGLIADEKK